MNAYQQPSNCIIRKVLKKDRHNQATNYTVIEDYKRKEHRLTVTVIRIDKNCCAA